MILPDVNILVYAHRQDAPDHRRYLDWLVSEVDSDAAFGLSPLVLSGFIRVVTHPRVFKIPSTLSRATMFVEQLRERPNCIEVTPGARHWAIFLRLCSEAGAKGNLVPDAYLAAMAIESGCEWVRRTVAPSARLCSRLTRARNVRAPATDAREPRGR
ncbi:type II toxin-antitoxin system VapC family toxin [Candidatus Palauibacter sp.]|uniref:type II toxin-antitoxin system VapC family toxin n=1 Tax=Candidatus Palauibacter sp. TaxID=3101350 RepID=UPI003D0C6F49